MRTLYFHNSISIKQVLFLWLTLCLLPAIAQATGSHHYNRDYDHKRDKHEYTDQDEKYCDNSLTVPLLIDEQIQVGVVKVSYDEYNLSVKYIANEGWLIEKTHLAVADSFGELPQDRYGNPKLRRFPYQTYHKKPVTVASQMLSTKRWPVGTELYIAAHVDVIALKPVRSSKKRFKAETWSGKWSKSLKASRDKTGDHDDHHKADEHQEEQSQHRFFKRFSQRFFGENDYEDKHRHTMTCRWNDKHRQEKKHTEKSRSAWSKGFDFPGSKDGFYFTYVLQPCKPAVISSVQFNAPVYFSSEDETSAKITVVRSGDLTKPATVHFTTSDGTAIGGVDYVPVEAELNFAPNVPSLEVLVSIIDDSEVEDTKTVNLQLSDAEGATLGEQDTAVLEIADNDEAVPQLDQFIFEPADYIVRESGDFVVVTVRRLGNLVGEATVDYAATGGSAVSPRDYQLLPGTLVFPDGVDTGSFTVIINEDRIADGDVTVELSLANAVNAELGAPAQAVIIIEDNETPN